MNKLTRSEIRDRIVDLNLEQKKAVICALVGHSRIQTTCFGYFSCARCGEQIGDTLGGSYPGAETAVIVGHDCETCRTNMKMLTWRDKFMAPDPFAAPKVRHA